MTPREPRPEGRPLNEEELGRIKALNGRMRYIERLCLREAEAIALSLQNRLKNPDDPYFADYEIEARISFHLHESDPEWDEDHDNILAERTVKLSDALPAWPRREPITFGTETDWGMENDARIQSVRPVCYLFHDVHCHDWELRDASRPGSGHALQVEDLLRIGDIWVDLSAIHQWKLPPSLASEELNA